MTDREGVVLFYSELQIDRRVFEKTGLFFFVYTVTYKQRYLNSKSDGDQNRVSMDGAVGRQTTESAQLSGPRGQKPLFMCHGVNKKNLSCFSKNTSIVLQLAVMFSIWLDDSKIVGF